MKVVVLAALCGALTAAAAPDALITPRPHPAAAKRQDQDPALLGWVSTSGQSECKSSPLQSPSTDNNIC
jgi:hypothetical protein